jgi:Protein of unknown function (DUF2599)
MPNPELPERPIAELDIARQAYDELSDLVDYTSASRLAALATTQESDIDFTPPNPETPTLRSRFFRSSIGRAALSGLTALGLAGGVAAADAAPAFADSGLVYTVTNHDHDGTTGVYARRSPHWSDSARQVPYYARYGDQVQLICGTNGDAVGPYNNHRWHLVRDLNNPAAGQFYLDDHDTNTPNNANQTTPGERECGTGQPNSAAQQPEEKQNPWDTKSTSEHGYIDHVVWSDTPYGKSLHVYVTRAGYLKSFILPQTAFAEVMRDAHLPYSESMYNQFVCHADVAPYWKHSWNLDIWRPDVGLGQTILDACNPQPGEVKKEQ